MSFSSICGLTSQFKFCGNCFRLDSYRGCNFGCEYCFVNNKRDCWLKGIGGSLQPKPLNPQHLQRLLDGSYISEFVIFLADMVSKKMPLHFGGMSDPFNYAEKKYRITLKMLRILNSHRHPVMISTKAGINQITDRHLKYCDPDLVAFQISISSLNQKFISSIERSSPSIKDRVKLIRKLKSLGYWVSIRIQPLVYLKDALEIVSELSDEVDFITVEHLKIMPGNWKVMKGLLEKVGCGIIKDFQFVRYAYSMYPEVKYQNIMRIKEVCKCKLGVGDNDLHYLSDSNNCCGIDCINANFDNWHKYNTMAMRMGLKGKPFSDIPVPYNLNTGTIFSGKYNTKPIKYFVDRFRKKYNRQLYKRDGLIFNG